MIRRVIVNNMTAHRERIDVQNKTTTVSSMVSYCYICGGTTTRIQ